jgi:hypothetical protein
MARFNQRLNVRGRLSQLFVVSWEPVVGDDGPEGYVFETSIPPVHQRQQKRWEE